MEYNSKAPQLNGACYSPPAHTRHRRSLYGHITKLLIYTVVAIGLAVLALWLFFRHEIKVYVSSASLSQFNLSDTSHILQYNLSLSMVFRNPNRRVGFYYDYIEARAIYNGSTFGSAQLPTFYQGRKSTTNLYPVFRGQGAVLGEEVSMAYDSEKGVGYYNIEVKVYARIRLKVMFVKVHAKPGIDCNLMVPVPGNASSVFEPTRCDVDFF